MDTPTDTPALSRWADIQPDFYDALPAVMWAAHLADEREAHPWVSASGLPVDPLMETPAEHICPDGFRSIDVRGLGLESYCGRCGAVAQEA